MRNTDQDWVAIGENEPFFGVLSAPRFLKDNLSEESLDEFWTSGQENIDFLLSLATRHFGPLQTKRALDFGCGVGRLTRALARHSEQVVGVDISPGMLDHARKGAPDNIEFLSELPGGEFDLIVSLIVMQHIPPQKGYGIFSDLLSRLALGGSFAIQVTLYKDETFLENVFKPITRASWDGETIRTFEDVPHPPGTMLMHDYDLTRLVSIAHRYGIPGLHLVHTNHGGCHGVIIVGNRPAA